MTNGSIAVTLASTLSLLLFAASSAQGQERWSNAGPIDPVLSLAKSCPLPKPLSGRINLDPKCYYEQRIVLRKPNTVLDCKGAEIRSVNRAIVITDGASGTIVRNCRVTSGGSIRVGRHNQRSRNVISAPRNVLIEHVHVDGAGHDGIYLTPHVSDTVVRNSIIENTVAVALYLDHGANNNIIEGNVFRNNGHRSMSIWGLVPRLRREAIAVDGAYENVIRNNLIESSASGGIRLYKNCWEFAAEKENSVQRLDHAHSNKITRNVIRNTNVGVWIASRQSRDLANWECGDATPYQNPVNLADAYEGMPSAQSELFWGGHDFNPEYLKHWENFDFRSPFRQTASFWLDFAEDTEVTGNDFINVDVGVRVEDDRAEIRSNRFSGGEIGILVGTPFRARLLDKPVLDTVISNNSFCADDYQNTDILLVPGLHKDSVTLNNRLDEDRCGLDS